ncbi:MAG: hypothetical protein NVSMB16_03860 [Acidimicrobiales bacterium]
MTVRRLTRFSAAAALAAAALVASASPAFADGGTARGAPIADLVPSAVVAAGLTLAVVLAGRAYRRGQLRGLDRVASAVAARMEMAPWAALPTMVGAGSLIVAAFGFYWDVSWHIDRGRDPGPFANPAHWFIIVGLGGIALAGILAVVLAPSSPTRTSVRFAERWHPPVGGVLVAICGMIALAGFPLDDVWHRIFGQDVTLWGPTHIQMVGGASLATLALWALTVEGRAGTPASDQHRPDQHRPDHLRPDHRLPWAARLVDLSCGGALLLGLSTLQGEFDYGVPQFRQLFHPVLIMLAAGVALVAARIRSGKGAALGAALFFIVLRGSLTVLIGPVLGRSTLHFPLYRAEARMVELVALRAGTDRHFRFGVVSGLGIGSVGLAAEWGWSHLWMPLPWHASLLPEAGVLGAMAAVSGGVLGAMVGRALAPAAHQRVRAPRNAMLAWAVALVCIAVPLPTHAPGGIRADVTLRDTGGAGGRSAEMSVVLHPASAAEHADWFDVTAWQGERNGRGGLIIAPLHRQADQTFSPGRPIPVSGTWKALIRLHRGSELLTLPVFLPADPGIPAAEVPASSHFTRDFIKDKKVLQREATGGSPALQRVAYAVLALLAACWIGSLAWGLRQLEGGRRQRASDRGRPRRMHPLPA